MAITEFLVTCCPGSKEVIPYPPGVPIACPGEVLTEEVLAYVKARRDADEKVIGITADGYVFVGK